MAHPEYIRFTRADADGVWDYLIPWQTGPVREVGVNGIQADDVLKQVQEYLRSFLPTAENGEPLSFGEQMTSMAIGDIGTAIWRLGERTLEREHRGVEGTSVA